MTGSGTRPMLLGVPQPGDRYRLWGATVLGLGLAPVAPGTFGTLGGVALGLALAQTGRLYLPLLLVTLVALYALGRRLGDWAESRALTKDPSWFVLDEVIGYLVVLIALEPPTPLALITAFVLFRVFDILKPWPVKRFERIGGGDGILLDDVAAGVLGLLVLSLLRLFLFDGAAWTRLAGG